MRIATYYKPSPANTPDEIIEVDDDIAKEFITNVAKMIRADNRRHKLEDRIAEVDQDNSFIRWLS
jgi:hypothetical protein